MKPAELKRELVSDVREVREVGKSSRILALVPSDAGRESAERMVAPGVSVRIVRVRRYRIERPIVHEVIEAAGLVYVLGDLDGPNSVVVVVASDVFRFMWFVEDDGFPRHQTDDLNKAKRYARKMLREAGYRVRRAK